MKDREIDRWRFVFAIDVYFVRGTHSDSFEVSLDDARNFAVNLHAVLNKHLNDTIFVALELLSQIFQVDALGAAISPLNVCFDLKLQTPQMLAFMLN